MPQCLTQLLRRQPGLAVVQREFRFGAAAHRLERVVGEQLRGGSQRLQRGACALRVARRRTRVHEQAQQLAAALAQGPVGLLERPLQVALGQRRAARHEVQPRQAGLRVPAQSVRLPERGLGGVEVAMAELDVAEHAIGIPFGPGRSLREQRRRRPDLGCGTVEIAVHAEHRSTVQLAGARERRHAGRAAPLDEDLGELRGAQPVAAVTCGIEDRAQRPPRDPGAHATEPDHGGGLLVLREPRRHVA